MTDIKVNDTKTKKTADQLDELAAELDLHRQESETHAEVADAEEQLQTE
jgi:hypothetical protein